MQAKYTLQTTYLFILLFIFALIPFHAPLSVALTTLFPDYELLLKSWKEILMLTAVPLAVIAISRHKKWGIFKDPLLVLISMYVSLHILMALLFRLPTSQTMAGLAIDLRYVLFFGLVYVAATIYPSVSKKMLRVGLLAGVVVVTFSLLQALILPDDILKYIGYSAATIEPYLTIDQNDDFVRINGTMRGPNPLGAYALIVMSLAAAYIFKLKSKSAKDTTIKRVPGVLLLVSPLVLWASYSRSALAAAIFSLVLVCAVVLHRKRLLKKWALMAGLPFLLITLLLVVYKDSSFVQHVFVHSNPTDTSVDNSNEGHLVSLIDGANRSLRQPLGAGPGSTGSASLLSDSPLIIENQYLFIAHEVGWLGLILFIAIVAIIFWRLWKERQDWLSLGVFASGLGLSVIGLLLPVWVDDSVSIIWWGLAALVLAGMVSNKPTVAYNKRKQ